jgi:ubiquinone/menaquinone biosynthesis C-methylase UbiE
MQITTAPYQQLPYPENMVEKVRSWLHASESRTLTSWIVEQLRIQSYQHILEVGYGNGHTLHEVAKKLEIGFLAGVDDTVSSFQQASRKNRKFIEKELVHLHLGTVECLPYPSRYFHTVYAGHVYNSWDEPAHKFMQLQSLLKSGGRLITVFQPLSSASNTDMWNVAEKIQREYEEAGFKDIRISFREMNPVDAVAAIGFRD